MTVFKATNADMTCNMGKGIFQYELGVTATAEASKCGETGLHACEYVLDCFRYYGLGTNHRFFIAKAEGDIVEDGQNTRISCTRLTLTQELANIDIAREAMRFMIRHPKREGWECDENFCIVAKDRAEIDKQDGIAIARGECPTVKGCAGAHVGLIVESGGEIRCAKLFEVREEGPIYPNTEYTMDSAVAAVMIWREVKSMKRKEILKVDTIMPKKFKGEKEKQQPKTITAQVWSNYLILDIFSGDGQWKKRHAMHVETGEYETFEVDEITWKREKLSVSEMGISWMWNYPKIKDYVIDKESQKLITAVVGTGENSWNYLESGCLRGILEKEDEYSEMKAEKAQQSKRNRLQNLMNSVPQLTTEMEKWIENSVAGDLHFAFFHKNRGVYHCTACNQDFHPEKVKITHKSKIKCPICGREVVADKRKEMSSMKSYITVIQNVDEKRGVQRHFKVEVEWRDKRDIYLDETIRLFMIRKDKRRTMKIYYSDCWGGWSEGNRCNRRWYSGLLYPDQDMIQDGLRETVYENWMDVMPQLAKAGLRLNYNRLIVEIDKKFIGTTEYLLKGRFWKLLREVSENITYWYGWQGSIIDMRADSIEEVFHLENKQLINRLRDADGGFNMLSWMQWSNDLDKRISDLALTFYEAAGINANDYTRAQASRYLSPEKLMNYLIRQKKESYPNYKYSTILNQYEDYLSMAKDLGKRINDEMVYKPRELKRRHDEASEECRIRQEEIKAQKDKEEAKRQAQKMREKYPGYEELLAEIKQKYEYSDGVYRIIVPENFAQITAEGMALHHCVGNTERYFERIVSRETYICFLRTVADPDKPYYTIEVEPGGTIRQHRGMLDEEPEIETIKPFLRKWQKEIRKRMNAKDHEYAKTSEILRKKNIEELTAQNNTRVLNGLMEDLMEVI